MLFDEHAPCRFLCVTRKVGDSTCHNRLLRGKQEELSSQLHRFRERKFLSDFMDGKVLVLFGRACLHPQLLALHAGEEDKK